MSEIVGYMEQMGYYVLAWIGWGVVFGLLLSLLLYKRGESKKEIKEGLLLSILLGPFALVLLIVAAFL